MYYVQTIMEQNIPIRFPRSSLSMLFDLFACSKKNKPIQPNV